MGDLTSTVRALGHPLQPWPPYSALRRFLFRVVVRIRVLVSMQISCFKCISYFPSLESPTYSAAKAAWQPLKSKEVEPSTNLVIQLKQVDLI